MKKKILVVLSLILLVSAVTVYASNAIYGYFLGYEKIKVSLDGKEFDSKVPAFMVENTTVLPLRAIAEALDVIVKWDVEQRTADLIKPNVNMQFTANPVFDKDKQTYVVYSPFGKIPLSQSYKTFTFYVYSEIDSLPHENVQIKFLLKDPDGNVVQEREPKSFDATEENSLQYIDKFVDIPFVKAGNYSVELLISSDSTKDEFVRIGKKLILVK